MDNVKLLFADGSKREYPRGMSLQDIVNRAAPSEAKEIVAARINGAPADLSFCPEEDGEVEFIKKDSRDGLEILRHSASHVMAQAVARLFPGVKLAIGPAIENGFYYDFDPVDKFAPADLERIEAEMAGIVKENLPFVRKEMSRREALEFFAQRGEKYKVELIEGLEDEKVSLYQQGEFTDLCRGPHLPSTGMLPAYKLLSLAGAYWRGDSSREMLQRIYGAAFFSQRELQDYLKFLEEAAKRDHRKLGRELDLFSMDEEIGAGLILWHPKGARIRLLIEDYWRDEHYKNGYELVYTPHIGRGLLWETSGHLGFFSENMYSAIQIEGQEYFIKPMNCPFHITIYKSKSRSYRDLPLRWAELGSVYRYEKSGVLHGLLRVRGFTQDDAHIFCSPEQMPGEIGRVLDFCLNILKTFGFENFRIYLATKPEKSVGEESRWKAATDALRTAIDKAGLPYEVDEGGGAFYGPKIDVKITDALGRQWQCSTIQFDFNEPERFGITYKGSDGFDHQPYMIHRALMGSLERFFGVLIEHYAGAFPVWLAPVQAAVLPIGDDYLDYGKDIAGRLKKAGLRCEVDERNEKIGYKIREAQLQKIPYMLVAGEKERSEGTVSVRTRKGEQLGSMKPDELIARIKKEAVEKTVS